MTRNSIPAISLAILAASALAQPNSPHWSDLRLLTGEGRALATHDPDGAGPAKPELYVGGNMEWSDEDHFLSVGRWNGPSIESAGFPLAPCDVLVEHDPDGTGPEPAHLYAASQGAVWRGPESWSAVGGKFKGEIYALATWDPDGPGPNPPLLVAGGEFTSVEGNPAKRIAAWDGAHWTPMGDGFDGWVGSLVTFDDDGDGVDALFAGGWFTASGNKQLGPIARWDGAAWAAMPGQFKAYAHRFVQALGLFDQDGPGPLPTRLHAAGDFLTIDGITVNHIAQFDGQSWLPLGAGLGKPGARVLRSIDLDGDGPDPALLYVGGSFGSAGGLDTEIIAAWDGQAWSIPPFAPPNPSSGDEGYWTVRDIIAADPDGDGPEPLQVAIVGLLPEHPSGNHPFLSWDGAGLRIPGSALGYGDGSFVLFSGTFAMSPWDRDGSGPNPPELALGGGFGGYLAVRGSDHTSLLPANLCCVVYDIGRIWAPYFYSFTSWDDDGPGPHAPSLFASFNEMEGFEGQHLLRLDGDGWHPLGPVPVDAVLGAFAAFDEDGPGPHAEALYCGGSFAECAGVAANSIVRWDGQQWSAVGGGLMDSDGTPGGVDALAVFDEDGDGPMAPALFVGGHFVKAGQGAAANIARWDGTEWTDVGGGITSKNGGVVRALQEFDEDGDGPLPPVLIAGGDFDSAGGNPADNLARWDGFSWSEVGGGVQGDENPRVSNLAVLDDDGPGPRPRSLFVFGKFTEANDRPAEYLARWDGHAWETIHNAPYPRIFGEMRAFDDDGDGPLPEALYIGGVFGYQPDGSPFGFARWGSDAPPPCPADCNADGVLDLFDFLCFVNLYNAKDPAADCTAEGDFDFFDFVCFINAFNAGC